ncbi:MAG TPA: glycoside hydrolase 100 family protein [Opitutus sp.]|nr:glycoside hydrolase 100 family protein [Opitutus sp.]
MSSPKPRSSTRRSKSPSVRRRHHGRSDRDPIEEARARSLEQLKHNACPHGIVASPIDRRNYRAIWSRDGCICAVAAYVSGDEELVASARRTLRTVAEHQADNGQVPSYLLIDDDDEIRHANYGGWGEITSIDSSLWFLIACQTAFMRRKESEFIDDPLFATYRRVFRYLFAVDANSCGLLEIPIAGDWTDIFNRSYHVLYDEVLWYRALRSGARLAEHASEGHERSYYDKAARLVRQRINDEFWWDHNHVVARVAQRYKIRHDLPKHPDFHYYQSHLTPFLNDWFTRFDSFANILAALLGVASPERTAAIIREVFRRKLDHPYPLRVLDPPIEPGDPDSHSLLLSEEPPFVYHNGGIWPLAGGFWVMLLSLVGKKADARKALRRLAAALRLPATKNDEWGFYEHLHGRTGEAMGTRDLSWNAAAYLLAYHAAVQDQFPAFTEHEERGAGPAPRPAG